MLTSSAFVPQDYTYVHMLGRVIKQNQDDKAATVRLCYRHKTPEGCGPDPHCVNTIVSQCLLLSSANDRKHWLCLKIS